MSRSAAQLDDRVTFRVGSAERVGDVLDALIDVLLTLPDDPRKSGSASPQRLPQNPIANEHNTHRTQPRQAPRS